MTRIDYVKPQVFITTHEALTQPPNFGLRFYPLSSCRLRSTSRFCTPLHRLGTGAFLGLLPPSAVIARHAVQASRPVAFRPQVFATSRQKRHPRQLAGLFHPAGTSRVQSSEDMTWSIGCCSQSLAPAPLSRPSWLPSRRCVRFPTA
jgi:hypothetical protein